MHSTLLMAANDIKYEQTAISKHLPRTFTRQKEIEIIDSVFG